VARAIFASGSPLSVVENIYWQRAFAALRPAYQLPSRYQLTNVYLLKEHNKIDLECREYLLQAPSLAILCDGWTNVRYVVRLVLTL